MVLIPPECFQINTLNSNKKLDLLDTISKAQQKDRFLDPMHLAKEGELAHGWSIDENQCWRYYDKIYIPPMYRKIVFHTIHSHITASHPGQKPTLKKVQWYYYWPDMKHDIGQWVLSLGARDGVLGWYTENTLQGHRQSTHPYTDPGTESTFIIFQANFFAVFLVQEMLSTFTVSQVM